MTLHDDWFTLRLLDGATLDEPGLYQWHIEGVGSYVGKFKRKSRPLRHYHRNVRRLLAGLPYRANNPDGFRQIHRELADAVKAGKAIVLTIVENPDLAELNRRERELIREIGTLNRC
ncbi:MAG TPA: hypothetical protein VGF77_02770 [Allosphingosinicella sp.]|jgi:hypothetical protein